MPIKHNYKFYILTNNLMCSDCVVDIGMCLSKEKDRPFLAHPMNKIELYNIESRNDLKARFEQKFDFDAMSMDYSVVKERNNRYPKVMRVDNKLDTVFIDYDELFLKKNYTQKDIQKVLYKSH